YGKTEFSAWWNNYKEYNYQSVDAGYAISGKMETLFIRNQIVKDNVEDSSSLSIDMLLEDLDEVLFIYFERLPLDFDKILVQYQLEEMVFTNYQIKNIEKMDDIFHLTDTDAYVQLL